MDVQPAFYNFSRTNQLNDIYKKSLISTKSVDFNVPLQHSNNFRGKALNNMRPHDPKLYKNSVKEHLVKFDKNRKVQTNS